MLGLADVSVYLFSLLPCIFCKYQYAARSPCIHVGSHLQGAVSSSAPLPQSPSQMEVRQWQVYLWTHKMGNFKLRGVSLLQPNPLPIYFSCDKILACFLWETWSVKWFSVGFFSPKGSSFFFLKQEDNLQFSQSTFFLDLTINFAKRKKSTGSTTDHKKAAFVFHGLTWWLMLISLCCFNSGKYWDQIWQIKMTMSMSRPITIKTESSYLQGSVLTAQLQRNTFPSQIPKKATEMSFILLSSQSSSLIFQKHLRKLFSFLRFCSMTSAEEDWHLLEVVPGNFKIFFFFFLFLRGECDYAIWRISHLALCIFQLALRAISCSSCICTRFVTVISLCSPACQRVGS